MTVTRLRLWVGSGDGQLNMKEFERWFVAFPLGDGRQAKAVYRQVDEDGGGTVSREELLEYFSRRTPHQLADLYAAQTVRNLAVTPSIRALLLQHGAVERCAAMLARHEEPDVRLAGALALLNLAMHTDCAHALAACKVETLLVGLLASSEEGCAAAMLVRQLGCVHASRSRLVAAGAVERLVAMLASRNRV